MKVKLRSDSVEIEGYVNAVDRNSRLITDEDGYPIRERIQPGVFGKALQEKRDAGYTIPILLNHDQTRVIAQDGITAELEEDSIGLHAVATITDPEVVEKARTHKLSGWSFGFRLLDYKDEYSDSGRVRIVTEMDLREVTLADDTRIPVYAGTSVHARANDEPEVLMLRTMDNDVVFTDITEDTPEPEAPEHEERCIDYSDYDNRIKKLRDR